MAGDEIRDMGIPFDDSLLTQCLPITRRDRDFVEKYIRITDFGEFGHKVSLHIDVQSFCVVEGRTKEQADWYALMVSRALQKIEDAEIKAGGDKRAAAS